MDFTEEEVDVIAEALYFERFPIPPGRHTAIPWPELPNKDALYYRQRARNVIDRLNKLWGQ